MKIFKKEGRHLRWEDCVANNIFEALFLKFAVLAKIHIE
jgi:hypothetical protein